MEEEYKEVFGMITLMIEKERIKQIIKDAHGKVLQDRHNKHIRILNDCYKRFKKWDFQK